MGCFKKKGECPMRGIYRSINIPLKIGTINPVSYKFFRFSSPTAYSAARAVSAI